MSVQKTSLSSHASRRSAPGAMTAVMRSISVVEGPRVLRIGLVEAGRMLEDRILKNRSTVTVGNHEDATFVLRSEASGSPRAFPLFERRKNGYVLNVLPGMTGRVATDDGILDVAGVQGLEVPLSEDARGRVTLLSTTFLFQFVAAPVAGARPQLPLAIRGGIASQIDWSLTIIAAFSFLAHFGVVGSMYSDWMDPVVDSAMTANGLIDLAKSIPAAPVEVRSDGIPDDAPAPKEPRATPSESAPTRANPSAPKPARPASPAEEAALSAAAASIGMSTLVALGGEESAVARALHDSEIPPVDLGLPAASALGARESTGTGLHLGEGTGPMRPGTTRSDLGQLAFTRVDPNSGKAGTERDRGGPQAVVTVSPPVTPTGSGEDIGAPRVVAGLRAGFRSCYNAGLSQDPAMSGKVMLSAKVGPNGEVRETGASDNVGLSAGVVQCLLKKLGTAQFDPGHGSTTVRIPAGFLFQQTK